VVGWLLLAVTIPLSAQNPPAQQAQAPGTISGRVSNASGPVRHARVTLAASSGPQRTGTDGDGRYRFERLAPGRYSITADKPGFAPQPPSQVEVLPATVHTVNVRLNRGGAIEGTFVDAQGMPVSASSIYVELESSGADAAAGAREISANEMGQFRVHSLNAGRYVIRVNLISGPGIADSPVAWYYPGTARREVAQVVTLVAGQTFSLGNFSLPLNADVNRAVDVTARLGIDNARGTSAIEGRVLDDFGDPAPWISVQLLTRRFIAGRFRLARPVADPGMIAETDDLGRFRFTKLLGGDYYLVGLPEPFSRVGYRREDQGGLSGLLPMFFPNFDHPADAQPIRLADGEIVPGLTIALPGAKTGTIVVRLLDENGQLRPQDQLTSIAAIYRTQGGYVHPALHSSMRSQDGRLVFRNVPAGEYALSLGYGLRVFVRGDDVINVDVPGPPRAGSSGRIVFDGNVARPSRDQIGIAWLLAGETAATIGLGPVKADIDAQWNVAWPAFGAPPAVVRLSAAPRGWALKRVGLGNDDVTDTPLEFRSGINGLEIVLTDRTGSVAGTVTVGGQPSNQYGVIVFSEDRDRWTYPSRFIHVGRANALGQFEIAGLLPGKYLALPLPNDTDEGADPEWLDMMRHSASPIVVVEGETARINVLTPQ
jgi:hypothetical protein